MRITENIRHQAAEQGSRTAKAISIQMLAAVTILAHIATVLYSAKGSYFPGADALMSIITTCSQIIAGLYGITMAGYTFFLSRIDALTASDATLDYVVKSIKNRFKSLIWFITGNVMMTLLISIVLMYLPVPEGEEISFFYRLFCNEFVIFVVSSIGMILYYSILVIDPNCIEKEAAKLKKKLGGRFSVPGNAVEFISLYDRIEERCEALLPKQVTHQLHENKGKRFELILELLEEQELLLKPLILDLTRIHRYYECVINCTPIGVSQDMCLLARKALGYLEQFPGKIIR